ncbi:MAG: hypothetical protein O3C40_26875 [Planctomycetota bacterium]|nr:hypothetical protein [Planctomycetota bacterium]
MTDSNENLIERGMEYASQRCAELFLAPRLGFGVHGSVFVCRHKDRPARTAVKVHERQESYDRERDAYLRLREIGVSLVCGHHVPALLDYDDALFVIEMTIVTRPSFLISAARTSTVRRVFRLRFWPNGGAKKRNNSKSVGPK